MNKMNEQPTNQPDQHIYTKKIFDKFDPHHDTNINLIHRKEESLRMSY